jgi:glycosyltransferase involved in cell wall biosynthesis
MWLYRFQVRWAHMKSRRIIVPTKWVAQEIVGFQPTVEDRIIVTYEASEPPHAVAAQQPAGIGKNDRFIMYLGTAFPHKNLEKLVAAFDILYAKQPELKLVLVGKKEKHYLELEQKVQQHRSAKNIIITGFLPDEQAKWLYEHCQAYVFASLSEGFGLPALEAMAHGAPIASSNASCLPEVYGDAAHYFNPHSAQDIADKVSEILEDKKLRDSLIKNGAQQVKKYSWHRMAEETLIVYKELLGETVDA